MNAFSTESDEAAAVAWLKAKRELGVLRDSEFVVFKLGFAYGMHHGYAVTAAEYNERLKEILATMPK